MFSTHGLPNVIVSDITASFCGGVFQNFTFKNVYMHIINAPYHTATNGLAENAVKTFENALKKCEGSKEETVHSFFFLFPYNAQHCSRFISM